MIVVNCGGVVCGMGVLGVLGVVDIVEVLGTKMKKGTLCSLYLFAITENPCVVYLPAELWH